MLTLIRLWRGEPPAMANISPSKYSLRYAAARSMSRYSAGVSLPAPCGSPMSSFLVRLRVVVSRKF
jgi:hypothetical protein